MWHLSLWDASCQLHLGALTGITLICPGVWSHGWRPQPDSQQPGGANAAQQLPVGAQGRGRRASEGGQWHRQGGSSSPQSRLPPRRPQPWFTQLRRKASCLGTPGLPPALPARASARAGTGGPGRQVDLTGPSPRLPPVAVAVGGEPLAPGGQRGLSPFLAGGSVLGAGAPRGEAGPALPSMRRAERRRGAPRSGRRTDRSGGRRLSGARRPGPSGLRPPGLGGCLRPRRRRAGRPADPGPQSLVPASAELEPGSAQAVL